MELALPLPLPKLTRSLSQAPSSTVEVDSQNIRPSPPSSRDTNLSPPRSTGSRDATPERTRDLTPERQRDLTPERPVTRDITRDVTPERTRDQVRNQPRPAPPPPPKSPAERFCQARYTWKEMFVLFQPHVSNL
eukprot:sb/3474800/